MRKSRVGAFTLIELLIVIAIIAILALIAIPNFLEAQTRAKVGRAKSDQRSLATAIESYTVDYRRCPFSNQEAKNAGATQDVPGQRLYPLTTPIAYMTSIPGDPFIDKSKLQKNSTMIAYSYSTSVGFAAFAPTSGPYHDLSSCFRRGYLWSLSSFGPTRQDTSPTGTKFSVLDMLAGEPSQGVWIYDPTNGTVSFGAIIRTNKGDVTGFDLSGAFEQYQ